MTGTNTVAALSISFSSLIKNIHVRTVVDDDDGKGDDVDDGDSGDDDNDDDDDDLSPGLKTKGSGHQEQQPLSILPHSLNHHLSTFMVMITTMINITSVTITASSHLFPHQVDRSDGEKCVIHKRCHIIRAKHFPLSLFSFLVFQGLHFVFLGLLNDICF